MMIARWIVKAQFGKQAQAINLLEEWYAQIGSQTDVDLTTKRIISGSVGADEAVIETEFEIEDLAELQGFFDKIGAIEIHKEWGQDMGNVVVSGSGVWQVFRVIN
ncbi:MAG: hypothetical protein AAF499_19105 [Pseudomonadota bacterium]